MLGLLLICLAIKSMQRHYDKHLEALGSQWSFRICNVRVELRQCVETDGVSDTEEVRGRWGAFVEFVCIPSVPFQTKIKHVE